MSDPAEDRNTVFEDMCICANERQKAAMMLAWVRVIFDEADEAEADEADAKDKSKPKSKYSPVLHKAIKEIMLRRETYPGNPQETGIQPSALLALLIAERLAPRSTKLADVLYHLRKSRGSAYHEFKGDGSWVHVSFLEAAPNKTEARLILQKGER